MINSNQLDFFHYSKDTKFIVFSDSMSSLEALCGFKIEVDLVLKIIKDYTSLMKAGRVMEFCWIPSHLYVYVNAARLLSFKTLHAELCQKCIVQQPVQVLQ